MLRPFALSLCLSILSALAALPVRAQPTGAPSEPPASAPSADASVSAPIPPAPSAAAIVPSPSSVPDPDAALTDEWVLRMTEARARRERNMRWGAPLMLASAAALGTLGALLPDLPDASRILFGVSALVPAALIIPTALSTPPNKPRWLAVGGFAFSAAFAGAGLVKAAEREGCAGRCGDEKNLSWLSAALVPSVLLLQLAFVDRGPSLQELEAYQRLPANNRAAVGRKLLARIERAERRALSVSVAIDLIATGVFATGAALMPDEDERRPLLGLGGATLGMTAITVLAALLKTSRLEQLTLGRPPSTHEMVFW